MMKNWAVLFCLFFSAKLFSFEEEPYLTPLAEFQFRPSYTYRYYPSVNKGFDPSSYNSHDQFVDLNLGVTFLPDWDVQGQVDFSRTKRLDWGLIRTGAQMRYLCLNDVGGDPVSLALSLLGYYVPTRALADVSTPYHAEGNLELGAAVGKEFSKVYDWLYRVYGFLGVGGGNQGALYLRPLLSFEFQYENRHRLYLFSEGYFGFGKETSVNINHFKGYGNIGHQSVDIGIGYGYHFPVWGMLKIDYSFRVYAFAFPAKASTFTLSYHFPFSLF